MARKFVFFVWRNGNSPVPEADWHCPTGLNGRSVSYTPATRLEFRTCPSREKFFALEVM